ncbi:glycosyltransferase family 2 protein [Emcibacter sp. SYSU 3D8]|uniref:glycosyltransferase family 2 protein n=1 Tax=Emcibacter sp. SYSU 3D8 TaxID=3133969 RepID=UPI0031FEB31C
MSVVVITKDEESDLPRFLENFLPIADEIVIIDDGSTDRTEEIARSAGPRVKFFSCRRTADEGFCDQRQKGVHFARGEWLLQVDCDMRLTPELEREIRTAIQSPNKIAYCYRLHQYFMNHPVRYGGFQYWNQPWLSRRSLTSWTQRVHERIHLDGPVSDIGQLQGRMAHLNDTDFAERLRKNYQYSHLEVERLLAKGETFPTYKVLFVPLWRFIRAYLLMRGFLDGRVGFIWALYQFTSNTTVYYLGWGRRHGGSRERNEALIRDAMERQPTSRKDGLPPLSALGPQ